jgi:hypothetical protein
MPDPKLQLERKRHRRRSASSIRLVLHVTSAYALMTPLRLFGFEMRCDSGTVDQTVYDNDVDRN